MASRLFRWVGLVVAGMTAAQGLSVSVSAPALADETAKIGMIFNQPEGDPFADLAYSGLERLQKEHPGIQLKRIAGVQPTAYEQQIRGLIKQGYNPVLVLWDDLAATVAKMAPDYPDVKFIVVDSYADPKLANVETVASDPTNAVYVAGVVAAKLSKTGKIGFVGGADQPVITKYLCGFREAIKDTAPSDEVIVNYAGSFVDPTKGREVALAQIDQGADVIMHAANRAGLGVLKAAAEKGKLGIGVDLWQGGVAPGSVPFTAISNINNATYNAVSAALAGPFKPGQYIFNSTTNLYDQRDLDAMNADTKAAVLEAIQKLQSGAVKPNC